MTKSARMQRQREITAHHEAGHAVIDWEIGIKIKTATIKRAGHILGHVLHDKIFRPGDLEWNVSPRVKMRAERAILATLAGPFAQKRFAPRSRWRSGNFTGTMSGDADFDRVYNVINRLYDDYKVGRRFVQYMEACAEKLVEYHWKEIALVAQRLIERETLTRKEVRVAIFEAKGLKPITDRERELFGQN
jgi:hypothetical protein